MTDTPIRILLVDDQEDFRRSCRRFLQQKGHFVEDAASGAEAMSILERTPLDVGIFDIDMPGMNGLELMQRVQESHLDIEVVFLTGHGTIATAIEAMKLGASDYLEKPCSLGELEHHCRLARDRKEIRKKNKQLTAIVRRSRPKQKLIGQSTLIQDVIRMIEKVAATNRPVLIEGESGTGKEVVARTILERSPLCDEPFVTINCAALPEQLVESELFGHQKGSFTGATSEKPGLFEIADGGTLFIDEIGELPLSLQPKLLRVLEDGSLRRIGCHRERHVKVRIIAATNRDLAQEVEKGNFREDLYYRINVLSLLLPPLRDRKGDVDDLIDHLLPRGWDIDDPARTTMVEYSWPGNVRQLINTIERATVLADHKVITLDDLPKEFTAHDEGPLVHTVPPTAERQRSLHQDEADLPQLAQSLPIVGSEEVTVDEMVKAHVLEVLNKQGGNKAKAARKLGIHRRKLYRLLERYRQQIDRTEGELESRFDTVEVG